MPLNECSSMPDERAPEVNSPNLQIANLGKSWGVNVECDCITMPEMYIDCERGGDEGGKVKGRYINLW